MNRQVDVKALVSHIIKGDGLDKCRICMGDTSQGQVHLGDTVMMDGDKPVTLSELLELITGVAIVEDDCCPIGACVGCASAALSAQEFRLFVRNSEKLWYKAISNLSNLENEHEDRAKSICAFITPNDLTILTAKDYTGGEPEEIVNRSKTTFKKTKRKARRHHAGPMSTCPDCNKTFTSPFFLQEHLKNNGQKTACNACGVVITRGQKLVEHMASAHNEVLLMCPQCPCLFKNSEELSKHFKDSHGAGVYTCTDCGRTFPRKSTFEHHSQMHLVRTCRNCNRQFTNRSCYREHRTQCEPDAKPDRNTIPKNRRSNIRDPAVFICDYCNKTYTTRPQLKNHILWIHMDHRPHQCQWCGKRFFTQARLAEHSVVHTRVRNFECDICGAKLVSKMAAVYHRRRHTGEKPYKCEDCDATFISSSRRLEHAKRKHNKGTRVQCPLCPNNFVRKSELKRHMHKAHVTVDESKNDVIADWTISEQTKLESVATV